MQTASVVNVDDADDGRRFFTPPAETCEQCDKGPRVSRRSGAHLGTALEKARRAWLIRASVHKRESNCTNGR